MSEALPVKPRVKRTRPVKPGLNEQDRLNPGLNEQDRLNPGLNEQDRLNPGLNAEAGLNPGLNAEAGLNEAVKRPRSIDGWTVQENKQGVFRLFKKLGGRVHGIYLGRTLDVDLARQKIKTKHASLGRREPKALTPADFVAAKLWHEEIEARKVAALSADEAK